LEEQKKLTTAVEDELQTTKQIVKDVQKCETKKLQNVTQIYDKKLENKDIKIQDLKKNVKCIASREDYYRHKTLKLEGKCTGEQEESCNITDHQDLIRKHDEVKRQCRELIESLQWTETLLSDNENKEIKLFDSDTNRYSDECLKCVFELLNQNVSVSRVGPVIETVCKLSGHTVNRLPSKTTIIDMNVQRLSLAHKQIAEAFALQENTCLLTDETSRKGSKYMGYEASDMDGKLWVLGIKDIATKSAADTLKVFKEILADIDIASNSSSRETSKLILQHIVATMSDRAATEVKFNTLLEDYRKTIMPVVFENFDLLEENEQQSLCKLANFFCGLHSLIHMAETSQKAIREAEKALFSDSDVPTADLFDQANEPGTVRLIRTASKAFAAGADDKSGCYGTFNVYMKQILKENNMYSLPLQQFRGSRFNILFSNAAGTFFLHKHMLEFLQKYGAENRLLKAVLKDLQVPEFIAGCKALALIGYFISNPLWNIIEKKSVHILDMNTKYKQLVDFLSKVSENPKTFMSGDMLLFG
jgi:hypothetical protein